MSHHILVTDDDPALLELYRAIFKKRQDLDVDYASTPTACKELLSQHSYDLALLDISLGDPTADGFALLDLIHQRSPQTDVLMMSSMDSGDIIDRCRRLGAEAFTSKNVDFPRHLRSAVNTLLEKKHSRPANHTPCQNGEVQFKKAC